MQAHDLKPNPGSTHSKRRLGRGNASGRGTYSGRGIKGQHARSNNPRRFFEGGQTELMRRLPRAKGFKNPFRVEFQVVNLDRLGELFPEGGTISVDDLVAKGAVRKGQPVKVLGQGDISVACQVSVQAFSASAKEKIEAAGGTATVV